MTFKIARPSETDELSNDLLKSRVRAKSLVDAVTERLEAAILGGELAPGSRLSEQSLAASLGGVDLWRTLHARAAADGRFDPEVLAEAVSALEASLGGKPTAT